MSEQKKQIVLAVCLALILVTVLAGASYYLIALEAPQTPAPLPPPPPATPPTPIVTPTPKPGIPSNYPSVEVELDSTTGFYMTDMGNTFIEKVLVLRQGTSGNITLKISSHYNESCRVSLDFSGYHWARDQPIQGVTYAFNPSTLDLPPEGEGYSTLILEASPEAPSTLLYEPMVEFQFEGFQGTHGTTLGFSILVFPQTPAYIFHIYAQESSTLTPPPPTPQPTDTIPTPYITPIPYPTPSPTPPAAPPLPSPEPEIQVEKGGKAQILFYTVTYDKLESPSLAFNLTCQSGPMPEGIKTETTVDPLQKFQDPFNVRSLLLTLTVDAETPEGTYAITAKITLDKIVRERVFNLKVIGP
ncbi:MAG: hypothetical protein QXN87_06220 [Candidatus Bathyarchaeia archaeon]